MTLRALVADSLRKVPTGYEVCVTSEQPIFHAHEPPRLWLRKQCRK